MTPEREQKRIQRALRKIPVDSVASAIAEDEAAGDVVWCLVGGAASLITVRGGKGETTFCDEIVHAQFVRWLQTHPERVHETAEAAVEFVHAKLAHQRAV